MQWHGGKGSGRRPEGEQGAYASGWDAIFGAKAKPAPEVLGYRADGTPIHPVPKGSITTCAFVQCCECHAAIRSNGGPMLGARCPRCYGDSGEAAHG